KCGVGFNHGKLLWMHKNRRSLRRKAVRAASQPWADQRNSAFQAERACAVFGSARDISKVSNNSIADTHRQACNPLLPCPASWNNQPDNRVPSKRPMALAM